MVQPWAERNAGESNKRSSTNGCIRSAIIRTWNRSDYLYPPLLNILMEDVEFIGVWDRSQEKARRLGEKCEAPWLTDLTQKQDERDIDVAIVSAADQKSTPLD